MQFRAFGRTGWQVSEIAFGGWQTGGDWGAGDAALRRLRTDGIDLLQLHSWRPAWLHELDGSRR